MAEIRAQQIEPDPVPLLEARVEATQELGPAPLHNHPARRVNRHGVFREVDVHLRMMGENGVCTRAEIRVIEDIHGWYVATSWTLEKGQYRGSSAPLSIHGRPLSTRAEALEEGKERIITATGDAAENDHQWVEKAKREAADIHDWVRKAVDQPEWFHRMTPDDIRGSDGETSGEETDPQSNSTETGEQRRLF